MAETLEFRRLCGLYGRVEFQVRETNGERAFKAGAMLTDGPIALWAELLQFTRYEDALSLCLQRKLKVKTMQNLPTRRPWREPKVAPAPRVGRTTTLSLTGNGAPRAHQRAH